MLLFFQYQNVLQLIYAKVEEKNGVFNCKTSYNMAVLASTDYVHFRKLYPFKQTNDTVFFTPMHLPRLCASIKICKEN